MYDLSSDEEDEILRDYDNIELSDSEAIEEKFQSIFQSNLRPKSSDSSNNWTFKRRSLDDDPISITSSASPVGMLVPAPTEHIQTRIGDRNVDDISDLSEAELDDLDATEEMESERNNKMNLMDSDQNDLLGLLEPGSLVSVQSLMNQSHVISEAKNQLLLLDSSQRDTKISSVQIISKFSDQNGLNTMNLTEADAKSVHGYEFRMKNYFHFFLNLISLIDFVHFSFDL